MKRRIAAEWEPVIGVMIAWPLHLPRGIVADLAKENLLFVIVEDEEAEEQAKDYLKTIVSNPANLKFLKTTQGYDAFWPRDWGPHPVFTENGELVMGCAQYLNSTPNSGLGADDVLLNPYTELFEEQMTANGVDGDSSTMQQPLDGSVLTPKENDAAQSIAKQLGFKSFKMPITLTGGNIMSDGRGSMISCAILTKENRFNGVSDSMFFQYAAGHLGVDCYSILSDYEDMGIQHVDCLLKMVDEEKLVVTRPPEDHPLYDRYERIVNEEISKLQTCYGRPYRIFRVDSARYEGEELAAYANALIVNQRVYVPMYGIAQDSIALSQWQEAMPGYEIKGFTYNYADCGEKESIGLYEGHTGWAGFDSIHCRTRSVWDKDMLYMSVRRIEEEVPPKNGYPIYIQIVDYSGKGLDKDALSTFWRLRGEAEWNRLDMEATPSREHYRTMLPAVPPGSVVEYYVAAKSLSGRSEVMPRVAPKGVYSFHVTK